MNYLFDTNVILRFLLDDIPSQAQQTQTLLKSIESGKDRATLPLLTFVELDFALRKFYTFPKKDTLEKLHAIARLPGIEIEQHAVVTSSLLYYELYTIDYIDAIFLAQAVIHKQTLVTFDKKLAKLAKSLTKEV